MGHGQAGSATQRTIYTSKSIYYVGHPVYAPLFEIVPGRKWAQVVLQCKIRPGSYRERNGTLGRRHWPDDVRMDPNYPTHEGFEFLVEDHNDVFVIGLLYRELGPEADATLYGDLVQRLAPSLEDSRGIEYRWTELLVEDHRRRGLMLASAAG